MRIEDRCNLALAGVCLVAAVIGFWLRAALFRECLDHGFSVLYCLRG